MLNLDLRSMVRKSFARASIGSGKSGGMAVMEVGGKIRQRGLKSEEGLAPHLGAPKEPIRRHQQPWRLELQVFILPSLLVS
jgi:hypothetical protein